MRLPIQVFGVVACKDINGLSFLILKRTEHRGGFWQPVTGGVEDGESLHDCVFREVQEETGITNIKKITNLNQMYQFKVIDSVWKGVWLTEFAFVVELEKKITPQLSDEHTEFKWVSLDEALSHFKWENNKDFMKKAAEFLSGN